MSIKIDIKKANIELAMSRSSEQAKFVKGKDEDKSMKRGSSIHIRGGVDDIFGFENIVVKMNETKVAESIHIIFKLATDPLQIKYSTNFFDVDRYMLTAQCFLDDASFVALSHAINYEHAFVELHFMEPTPIDPHSFNVIECQEMHNVKKNADGLLIDLTGKSKDDYWINVNLNLINTPKTDIIDQDKINQYLSYGMEQLISQNETFKNYLWIMIAIICISSFLKMIF